MSYRFASSSHSRGVVPSRVRFRLRRGLLLAFGAAAIVLATASGSEAHAADGAPGDIVVAEIDGAIDSVMSRFVSRILNGAADGGVELVVLRIDTPGGRLDSTRDIVMDILASDVPVVSYVGPSGARAASAGTFIAASAGIAAMAPSTNIGAATPIDSSGGDIEGTLGRKVTNDAAAFIRSIAETRGRNADALEGTVREASSYSADEAVQGGIVNLIAPTIDDLITQLDGMAIPAAAGDVVVHTDGARVRTVGFSFFESILSFLSSPDIVFLFFSLGGLALVIELFSPGLVGPGVVGVILLLLSFAGLGQIPFNWAGVALLVLAFVLIYVETQVPGFGIFGIGGAVSLVLGGLFLVGFFGTPSLDAPDTQVSRWLLGVIGGIIGLIVLWFGRELRRSRNLPAYVSPLSSATVVGQSATVSVSLSPEGEVFVAGESWTARLLGGGRAEEGDTVKVRGVDGLTLEVEADSDSEAGDRS